MHLNTDGLVIKENQTGENDRVITLLTRDYGVLRAFVRGAKNVKSRSLSATQLLGYSSVSLYRGRDAYIVDEAQPIEIFFDLRDDIERLSLAQYFCELVGALAPQEMPASEQLSLTLNSIHLLAGGKRPQPFLKAVFELRLMCLSGYMPDLVACGECGKYLDEVMYFSPDTGSLRCRDCGAQGTAISPGILSAMRHICYSEAGKIFSFTLSDESLIALSQVTEKYMLTHLQHSFKTLSFYKALTVQ